MKASLSDTLAMEFTGGHLIEGVETPPSEEGGFVRMHTASRMKPDSWTRNQSKRVRLPHQGVGANDVCA